MVSILVPDEDVSINVQGDTFVVSGERRSMFEKDEAARAQSLTPPLPSARGR